MEKNQKIEIEIKGQIEEAVDWFGENITKKPTTLATKNLFNVQKDSEELNEEKSDLFQSILAKLLYICKRARPDVETVVAYLCTRVSKSTMEDWSKLRRVLAFLKKTIDDIRIIGADSMQEFYTWIDATYGVHEDLKSHTGRGISMGTGLGHSKSSKEIKCKNFYRSRVGRDK